MCNKYLLMLLHDRRYVGFIKMRGVSAGAELILVVIVVMRVVSIRFVLYGCFKLSVDVLLLHYGGRAAMQEGHPRRVWEMVRLLRELRVWTICCVTAPEVRPELDYLFPFLNSGNTKTYCNIGFIAYSGFLHKIQYIGVKIPVSAAPTKASAPFCNMSIKTSKSGENEKGRGKGGKGKGGGERGGKGEGEWGKREWGSGEKGVGRRIDG